MPVHRVPTDDLEDALVRLERSGEHVEHVVPVPDGFVLITSHLMELRSAEVDVAAVCRFRPYEARG